MHLRLISRLHPAIFVAVALSGCGHNVYFSDDEGGLRSNDDALGNHADELSVPYALGTKVDITLARASASDGPWQVTSDSPSVLSISGLDVHNDGTVVAHALALAEGASRIHMLDGAGREHRAADVRVAAPDGARFYSHGDLRVAAQDDNAFAQAEVTQAQILAGGQAVFPVAYFHGPTRVYGRGIAQLDGPAGFQASAHTTSGRPSNEWIFVDAPAAGTGDLHLSVGGAKLATISLAAVPESQLVSLALLEQSTAKQHDKDDVWLFARATDVSGREVLGVYCDWTLDGSAQARKQGDMSPPQGDLYRYQYAPGSDARMAAAHHGALAAALMVPAHGGYVADTTYLGCSAAPGAPVQSSPAVALALLALVAVLLRRAA